MFRYLCPPLHRPAPVLYKLSKYIVANYGQFLRQILKVYRFYQFLLFFMIFLKRYPFSGISIHVIFSITDLTLRELIIFGGSHIKLFYMANLFRKDKSLKSQLLFSRSNGVPKKVKFAKMWPFYPQNPIWPSRSKFKHRHVGYLRKAEDLLSTKQKSVFIFDQYYWSYDSWKIGRLKQIVEYI